MQDPFGGLSVVSPDGTPVVAYGTGQGPPLLAVHGTGETSVFWKPLAPVLGNFFTVYAVQRRGRGKSGDSSSYCLEKEAEDIAALADALGEPVVVFGHCFGANCALEGALLTDGVARLVLYEPRVMFPYSDGAIDQMEALVSQGEQEEVLLKYFVESDLSMEELMKLRHGPDWAARFDSVATVPRECREDAAYRIDAARAADLDIPVLLLHGADSSDAVRRGVQELSECLPEARTEVIRGAGPTAISAEPGLVASLMEPD